MKKQCNVLLSLGLLACCLFASCGDQASQPSAVTETETLSAAETETAETEPVATSNVPEGTSFTGEILNILNSARYESERALMNATEQNGEVLNDAVYARNADVADKFGFTVNYIDHDEAITTLISKEVMSGDTTYDILSGIAVQMLQLVTKNLYYDLQDAPYIDVSSSWWATDYINNLSISNNRRFFVTGDITPLFLRWLPCVYVNKNVYTSNYDSADSLYQTVLDGKWTLDMVNDLTKDIYQDLNGNNKVDTEDMLGSGVIDAAITDSLFMSAGGQYSSRTADGTLVIDAANERNLEVIDKIYTLYFENEATYMYDCTWEAVNEQITSKFLSDQMLFMYGWLYTSDYLRDMKSDYMILPMPKVDEDMESYRSIIYVDTEVFCLPVTCTKLEASCAFLEEMAFIGYENISPTYYETVLKGKYIRDNSSEAMQMIDLVHDGAFTDAAYAYSNAISIGIMHRTLVQKKSKDWMSVYEKKSKVYQKEIDKLMAAFEESEA